MSRARKPRRRRYQDRYGHRAKREGYAARSVYKLNDRRAALKRAINLALGSTLVEEKSYKG